MIPGWANPGEKDRFRPEAICPQAAGATEARLTS